MANSVVNSKFKPFSYSEMLAPMAAYTEVYNQNEQALGNIALESSVWEKLGENPIDAPTYKRYKDFQTQTEQQIDNLAKNGLTQDVRRNLMNVQQNYGKTIMPIKQAYEARSKQMEEQQKASLADKSLIFDRTADKTSLEDYIKNPVLAYKGVSRDWVTQSVAAAMQNYKGQLRSSGTWSTTASGQMLQKIEQFGLAPEDINEIINNPDRYPEIQKLLKDTVDATGVQNFTDPEAKAQVLAAAQKGLWAGIGKTDVKEAQNQNFLNTYQQLQMKRLQSDMDNDAELLKLKQQKANQDEIDGINNSTKSHYTISSEGKEIDNLIENLSKSKFERKIDAPQYKSELRFGNFGKYSEQDVSASYNSKLKKYGIDPTLPDDKIKEQLLKIRDTTTKQYNSFQIRLDPEGSKKYLSALLQSAPAGQSKINDIVKMDGTQVTDENMSYSDLQALQDGKGFEGVSYAPWIDGGKGGQILKVNNKEYYVKNTAFNNESSPLYKTLQMGIDLAKNIIEDKTSTPEEVANAEFQMKRLQYNYAIQSIQNIRPLAVTNINVTQ